MNKIKLVVTDIGGTLLSDNNVITKENIEAFKYASDKGIKIALATARMYSSTKYIANTINADYGIYGNGIHLMDIKKLQTIKKTIMDQQTAEKVVQYAKENDIYVHLCEEFFEVSDQTAFFALKHLLLNKNYEDKLKSNIKIVDSLLEYIKSNPEIIKILFVSEDYLDKQIEDIKNKTNGDRIFLNEYYKNLNEVAINKIINYAEFGCSNDTKATGIIRLADLLGIGTDEIMAIGDLENDIEMLSVVGYPIAMKNGKQKVKEMAKYITTKDNNNSGVAESIYRFIK